MSFQPTQIQTFTSILTLLSVQHPYLCSQLQYLRAAVIKWHQEVQQQKLQKNLAILSAKTRGNQKLAVLFLKIDNYFSNLFRCYNDPNLKLYYRQFVKIKEQFQFIDIQIDKFKMKGKDVFIQTQNQNVCFFGIDVDKLLKNLQNKHFQLNQANNKILQIEDQKHKLRNSLSHLSNQMKQIQDQYISQIKQLKQFLEKTKAQAVTQMSQTQKKMSPNYRSNPEIIHTQFMSNKKIRKNLLSNAYQDSLMYQVQPQVTSIEQININQNSNDASLFRLIFTQASAIQGILQSLATFQKAIQS